MSSDNNSVKNARNYVSRVKSSLGQTSSQYKLFLETLKSYRTRELSPSEVISRISDIFQHRWGIDRRELILGFNAFLPPEYQISEEGLDDDDERAGLVPIIANDAPIDDVDNNAAVPSQDPLAMGTMPQSRKRVRASASATASSSTSAKKKSAKTTSSKKKKDATVSSTTTTTTSTFGNRNIKVTSYASARSPSSRSLSTAATAAAAATSTKKTTVSSKLVANNNIDNKKKINISTTKIILSPPNITSNDLQFGNNLSSRRLLNSSSPLVPSSTAGATTNVSQSNMQISPVGLHSHSSEQIVCTLCHGQRDKVALENNEPVLLCEQRGCCTSEYHLGCLYMYCPTLFGMDKKKKDGEEKKIDDDVSGGGVVGDDDVVEVAAMEVEKSTDSGDTTNKLDEQQPPSSCEFEIPSGDIYCTSCYKHGATSVLEQYFDKVEKDRSNYTCNRAYVMALLEKHMRLNPMGNTIGEQQPQSSNGGASGDAAAGEEVVKLKAPPRSELWYANEVNNQALGKAEVTTEGSKKKKEDYGAEFLVGKPVRLYNNFDNEYHVGRIVDWRASTVYPPLYDSYSNNAPHVSKDDTVQMSDLEYYGIGPLSTTEFLVRFPAGLQGRKKELLRWIMLEEHCFAVGISLIEGRRTTYKTGGAGGGTASVHDWKPAMILARSALELVTVRSFLHEDTDGILFATMTAANSSKSKDAVGGGDSSLKGGDRWALAAFFGETGEEEHALLHLRDEARDLKCLTAAPSDNMKVDLLDDPLPQAPLASVDVPLSLALAEHSEQERCQGWSKLILQKSDHKLALVAADEYATQLALEENESDVTSTSNGSKLSEANGGMSFDPTKGEHSYIRPLVERGMDRLWLAQLAEKISGASIQLSKDTIMSLKCEKVSSVASAMATLQRG